jgi:DNA repair exonuclease SbcCD ATPase subunit/DNA-directed RNA polymerase subunit RPC12/RpoP
MKAQSYYRCENCGKIAARDAGKVLSSCPDCGNGKLKILVPVDDEMKGDPLSGRKKIALAALIGFVGVALVSVFLIFGQLLHGYMTFEAGREIAEKANKRLAAEIQALEARKSTLADTEARLVALTNQTSQAETERSRVLEALKTTNIELLSVTGTVEGVKVEVGALKREKNKLIENVDLQKEELKKREAEVQKASETVRQLEASAASAKIVQAALDALNKARDKAREEADAQSARVASLASRKDLLDTDIRDMEKTKGALDAAIAEQKKQQATKSAESAKVQAALDALNKTRETVLNAEVSALEKAKADAEKKKGGTER